MLFDEPCPCGTGTPYTACCGALHRGDRQAATASELMRSRYAAFARGEADYLIQTWHSSKRGELDRRSLAESGLRWVGLTILGTEAGAPGDDTGVVEFEARYQAGGNPGVLHERSRFVREDGAWVYVDGATRDRGAAKAGRNDPCPCGSGKKYKRCCGA